MHSYFIHAHDDDDGGGGAGGGVRRSSCVRRFPRVGRVFGAGSVRARTSQGSVALCVVLVGATGSSGKSGTVRGEPGIVNARAPGWSSGSGAAPKKVVAGVLLVCPRLASCWVDRTPCWVDRTL